MRKKRALGPFCVPDQTGAGIRLLELLVPALHFRRARGKGG